jgi:hypothetical protein
MNIKETEERKKRERIALNHKLLGQFTFLAKYVTGDVKRWEVTFHPFTASVGMSCSEETRRSRNKKPETRIFLLDKEGKEIGEVGVRKDIVRPIKFWGITLLGESTSQFSFPETVSAALKRFKQQPVFFVLSVTEKSPEPKAKLYARQDSQEYLPISSDHLAQLARENHELKALLTAEQRGVNEAFRSQFNAKQRRLLAKRVPGR